MRQKANFIPAILIMAGIIILVCMPLTMSLTPFKDRPM